LNRHAREIGRDSARLKIDFRPAVREVRRFVDVVSAPSSQTGLSKRSSFWFALRAFSKSAQRGAY
jgi:hypothetical protein